MINASVNSNTSSPYSLPSSINSGGMGGKPKKGQKTGILSKIPTPIKNLVIFSIFLTGLYLLVYPFIPAISFLVWGGKPIIPYESKIEKQIWEKAQKPEELGKTQKKPIPEGRRLVIPSISVDMPIVDAASEDGLAYGVWRRPNAGTLNSGNMVLTGHRLGYGFLPNEVMKSSSFYNLDKLKDGDYIIIYWDGEEYDYIVKGGEEVEPTETRIEGYSDTHKLTLYTCTPIGINSHRLVKYAFPIEDIPTANSNQENSASSSSSNEINNSNQEEEL
jgi:LPXTG-site transpeptidase (sortase) family protein